MLFSVGMYLPLETTFAIFIGGLFGWATDSQRDRSELDPEQRAASSRRDGPRAFPWRRSSFS